MNDYLFILVIGTVFNLILLVGVIVIVFQFRTWAYKRDEYYNKKLLEYEERMHDMEVKYLRDLAGMLNENKELLKKIY